LREDATNIVEKEITTVPLESEKNLLLNSQSMASFLSMGSAEVEVGFLQVHGTMIDFASQME